MPISFVSKKRLYALRRTYFNKLLGIILCVRALRFHKFTSPRIRVVTARNISLSENWKTLFSSLKSTGALLSCITVWWVTGLFGVFKIALGKLKWKPSVTTNSALTWIEIENVPELLADVFLILTKVVIVLNHSTRAGTNRKGTWPFYFINDGFNLNKKECYVYI